MLDELLIPLKIKEGNIKAFEELFRRYYSPLCGFVFSITGNSEASEEIVEELFYKLWRDRETLNIVYSIKSYLYKAARNDALQHCEHREVKLRYEEKALQAGEKPATDPQEEMEYAELESLISEVIRKLPSRSAQIFKMHRFEAKKYKEIAQLLSISIKTVEAEMSRTLKLLKNEIDNYTR